MATATQATTTQANPFLIDPTKVPQTTAATQTVDPTKTVNGLVGQYLQQNNPVTQTAQTQALQSANARGLSNSTMAVQAGQQAAINSVMPMAQQDSQNYAGVQTANQNATNQTNQYNTGLLADALKTNTATQNQNSQFNTQQSNAQSQFNASQSNDILKTQMDMDSRTNLANIESNYKTLMQANASAGEMYQQAIKNVTDIQTNKDMDAGTKAAAINNQLFYLKESMQLIEQMNRLSGLDELLSF
jgi:hypothetical protein